MYNVGRDVFGWPRLVLVVSAVVRLTSSQAARKTASSTQYNHLEHNRRKCWGGNLLKKDFKKNWEKTRFRPRKLKEITLSTKSTIEVKKDRNHSYRQRTKYLLNRKNILICATLSLTHSFTHSLTLPSRYCVEKTLNQYSPFYLPHPLLYTF